MYPGFRWILKDVKSGRWKSVCEFNEMYGDLSKIFYPDVFNVPDIPQLKPLLEGQSYSSCPSVETLFQTTPNFELNSNHKRAILHILGTYIAMLLEDVVIGEIMTITVKQNPSWTFRIRPLWMA